MHKSKAEGLQVRFWTAEVGRGRKDGLGWGRGEGEGAWSEINRGRDVGVERKPKLTNGVHLLTSRLCKLKYPNR